MCTLNARDRDDVIALAQEVRICRTRAKQLRQHVIASDAGPAFALSDAEKAQLSGDADAFDRGAIRAMRVLAKIVDRAED